MKIHYVLKLFHNGAQFTIDNLYSCELKFQFDYSIEKLSQKEGKYKMLISTINSYVLLHLFWMLVDYLQFIKL